MYRALPLYLFLNLCNASGLEKEILECGAGVYGAMEPLLVRFYQNGFRTHGIELDPSRLAAACRYANEHQMELDIRAGDMRRLEFGDEAFSFVYSFNSSFHMTKADIARSVAEMKRVLKPEGLLFVNFLSLEDGGCGEGQEVGPGEFLQMEEGEPTIHSYFDDQEGDLLVSDLQILRKEKRVAQVRSNGETYTLGYMDYIAKK